MIVKMNKCLLTSSLPQEDMYKIIIKRNLQIHLYSLKEVTRHKIDSHFNLIFSNSKNLIRIIEMKGLLK